MEQAPIPGAQSHVPSPYNYPIPHCYAQCVTGRYGCLDGTIPTDPPPFSGSPTLVPGMPGGAYLGQVIGL